MIVDKPKRKRFIDTFAEALPGGIETAGNAIFRALEYKRQEKAMEIQRTMLESRLRLQEDREKRLQESSDRRADQRDKDYQLRQDHEDFQHDITQSRSDAERDGVVTARQNTLLRERQQLATQLNQLDKDKHSAMFMGKPGELESTTMKGARSGAEGAYDSAWRSMLPIQDRIGRIDDEMGRLKRMHPDATPPAAPTDGQSHNGQGDLSAFTQGSSRIENDPLMGSSIQGAFTNPNMPAGAVGVQPNPAMPRPAAPANQGAQFAPTPGMVAKLAQSRQTGAQPVADPATINEAINMYGTAGGRQALQANGFVIPPAPAQQQQPAFPTPQAPTGPTPMQSLMSAPGYGDAMNQIPFRSAATAQPLPGSPMAPAGPAPSYINSNAMNPAIAAPPAPASVTQLPQTPPNVAQTQQNVSNAQMNQTPAQSNLGQFGSIVGQGQGIIANAFANQPQAQQPAKMPQQPAINQQIPQPPIGAVSVPGAGFPNPIPPDYQQRLWLLQAGYAGQ